jgi:hypothetical protein
MEDLLENNNIEEHMYAELKKLIENKLIKQVNRIVQHAIIKYNSIYTISFKRRELLKAGILKPNNWVKREYRSERYTYEKERILCLNRVCTRILREHYKIEPVFKFGFDNTLCYDIVGTDFFLFFRLLK